MKWIVGFARFWYDFVVGDSVALAIGGVSVLVLGTLLVRLGAASLAQVLLPIAVSVTLALSLRPPQ